MSMEHFLCAQPRVSHWGCRDKSNSPHLPGAWSPVEKINKQADNDRIAFVLKKCSLADLCFENTELVREEYQKDYMFTEVEHSNSKEMEEGSQEHKRDYLRPCLAPCPVPNLRALFSPSSDVILWSLRWMWALAGAQGALGQHFVTQAHAKFVARAGLTTCPRSDTCSSAPNTLNISCLGSEEGFFFFVCI